MELGTSISNRKNILVVRKDGILIGNDDVLKGKLHVEGGISNSFSSSGRRYVVSNATSYTFNNGQAYTIGAYFENYAWTQEGILATSDRRIKDNIIDVSDNKALNMLRNIPCRYYEYKDKVNKGYDKTIGFIAQEVKEVIPVWLFLFKKMSFQIE